MAMATGLLPTLIGLNTLLVAVSKGVTVSEPSLTTKAVNGPRARPGRRCAARRPGLVVQPASTAARRPEAAMRTALTMITSGQGRLACRAGPSPAGRPVPRLVAG